MFVVELDIVNFRNVPSLAQLETWPKTWNRSKSLKLSGYCCRFQTFFQQTISDFLQEKSWIIGDSSLQFLDVPSNPQKFSKPPKIL